MASVTFEQASRIFDGSDIAAVDRLDLHIDDGEFLVLVGPSGSGKSTALRMLAGLEQVDTGAIRIGDRDVTDVAPKHRDIAMVFQNYALYPHMTVAENMAFALKLAGVSKDVMAERVQTAAKMLDLVPFLERKPRALSGGQRQRVAMGRAIVREPQVFLMDEPLSNLDAMLRVQTRTEIAALQRRIGVTTVYVTHDQTEAMTMGDRVAVLKDGRLQQAGTPRELYERPANAFVASFIGSPAMNLLPGLAHEAGVHVGDAAWSTTPPPSQGCDVVVGLRPEDVVIDEHEGLELIVELVEVLGADAYVYGDVITRDGPTRMVVRTDGRRPPRREERLKVVPRPGALHLFDHTTGERITP